LSQSFLKILEKYVSKYLFNTFIFNIKVLNVIVNGKITLLLYKKLSKFAFSIFSRRYNLFLDFLKLTALFFSTSISLACYTKVWGEVFKNISKRLHQKFLMFINDVFSLLLNLPQDMKNSDEFFGMKFRLAGRFRAKDRACSKIVILGSVPTQTLIKNVVFSSCHAYTVYGSFGLKFWVYQKSLVYNNIKNYGF